jgi:hypothetical protein
VVSGHGETDAPENEDSRWRQAERSCDKLEQQNRRHQSQDQFE